MPDLTTLQGVRDRALMELLWSTGIRRGEVVKLEVYSVDASRRTVTIIQGKGKKDRVVPVGARALWWIAHYVQQVRPPLLGHASVESTQIYTQVPVRALQAVHATTHPAERETQIPDDNLESNHHNDNTTDTA